MKAAMGREWKLPRGFVLLWVRRATTSGGEVTLSLWKMGVIDIKLIVWRGR